MATWEDGPEYAPRERPAGFDAPAVAPLDVAPPRTDPSAGAPVIAPEFHQEHAQPPLAAYAPETGPERDPQQAFAVASATLTDDTNAWGAVAHHHADAQAQWAPPVGEPVAPAGPPQSVPHPDAVVGPPPVDPMTPITLTQGRRGPAEGPVGPPDPFPPPPAWQPPSGPPPPVAFTVGGWFAAMRPATVGLLLLGGIFWIISPLCFAGAAWSAWGIRRRSEWIRNAVMVGVGVLGVTAVLTSVMLAGDLGQTWTVLGQVSMVVCWLFLAAVAAIVGLSLARGEQPEWWG